ncbi:MAG TPA: alpha/beta fold hydrolase [Vicinamibacterales bacterium]|nr:alpha/beta fold hydrolase [Vicinamibacterales bacterium]
MWNFREEGSGRPIVLLHGIGMSHAAWRPVMPYLSATRRVIAFDIAGFGSTPPLPLGTPPTVANLAERLVQSLREMGLDEPVDLAGNSLGGAIALETAKRGLARSIVAISPAGLWRDHDTFHVKYVFGGLRFTSVHFPRIVKAIVRRAWLRELALAVPISIGSQRMPAEDAVRAVDDLAAATGFEATFKNTRAPFSGAGITVPTTISFGARDWILPRRSQHQNGLPADTRWIRPQGWGHVPMWADPEGVARLILDGTPLHL